MHEEMGAACVGIRPCVHTYPSVRARPSYIMYVGVQSKMKMLGTLAQKSLTKIFQLKKQSHLPAHQKE